MKTIMILILLLLLTGCGESKEEEQEDDFTKYCNSFCIAVDMEMAEGTSIEEHTLNCVCEKIFLKKNWEEENK